MVDLERAWPGGGPGEGEVLGLPNGLFRQRGVVWAWDDMMYVQFGIKDAGSSSVKLVSRIQQCRSLGSPCDAEGYFIRTTCAVQPVELQG